MIRKHSILILVFYLLSNVSIASPIFKTHNAIQTKNNSLGDVLSDIESHMTAGHQYRDNDKATWGHETTHGINSLLRNKEQRESRSKVNAFYVLDDRYVVINELDTKLSTVAKNVPASLRYAKLYTTQTTVYNLYLKEQTQWWENEPSYIFDEWTAYTNGALVSMELDKSGIISDITHMAQFNVFALTLAYTARPEDEQFKEFLKWQLARSMKIIRDAGEIVDISDIGEYWTVFENSEDAEDLRRFTREYLGENWVKKNLGI